MISSHLRRTALGLALTCLFFAGFSQGTLRVMHYNVLMLGNPCGNVTTAQKYGWLADILNATRPDLLTLNEVAPSSIYARGIQQISFANRPEMEFAPFTNQTGSDIINMLFYNRELLGFRAVSVIPNPIRDINVFTLYLRPEKLSGLPQDTVWIDVVVGHLKAGATAADRQAREAAAIAITNWLAAQPAGRNALLCGDLNLYGASEPAFQRLIFNPDTLARFFDPASKENGWNGPEHAAVMTQSTRLSSNDCGSGGGMDDRFDFILASRAVMEGLDRLQGLPQTYQAFGNHGLSYDQELACLANGPVTPFVCGRLKLMSDHLPVLFDLAVEGLTASARTEALPIRLYASDGEFYLSNDTGTGLWRVSLFDVQGRQVFQAPWKPAEGAFYISNTGLPSGLFMVRVADPTGRQWQGKIFF